MKRPRVVLAEDHRLMRELLVQLLEPHCDVLGQAADGHALLELVQALQPDVAVLDIGMPLLNGLDAARQLKRSSPGVKVVFLTASEDQDVAAAAFRAGASGYLLKNSAATELLIAIQEAMAGRVYVTPQAARGLVDSLMSHDESSKNQKQISARQREVLQLLAEGRTMKEAAKILKITPRTIAFHKYSLMEVLGIASHTELIQYAIQQRLVAPLVAPHVAPLVAPLAARND